MDRYILNEQGEPVIEYDLTKWAEWMGSADRKISFNVYDGVRVSTVFLGLDHSWDGKERLLYETMIFEGEHDSWCQRTATREGALASHDLACVLARHGKKT